MRRWGTAGGDFGLGATRVPRLGMDVPEGDAAGAMVNSARLRPRFAVSRCAGQWRRARCRGAMRDEGAGADVMWRNERLSESFSQSDNERNESVRRSIVREVFRGRGSEKDVVRFRGWGQGGIKYVEGTNGPDILCKAVPLHDLSSHAWLAKRGGVDIPCRATKDTAPSNEHDNATGKQGFLCRCRRRGLPSSAFHHPLNSPHTDVYLTEGS